jgi:hypothetical protein
LNEDVIMKNHSIKKAAFMGLVIAASVMAGCGGDGGSAADPAAAPAAGTPAAGTQVASSPSSNSVPLTASDSPSLFVAFVKTLTDGDETSEALSVPDLKEAGDEAAEPQVLGA